MSSRGSNRGRGDGRGGRGGPRSPSPGRGGGSRPPTPTSSSGSPRSRSPQRSPSPEQSSSSTGGRPQSGHPRGASQRPAGGQRGGFRQDRPGGQSTKADRSVMFTKSLPDQKVAEFEKRSLESKNNTKQKPQRDLRSKKSKEEQGPQVHLELVRRPGYGTRGKLINLSANFLSMMFKPGATFYAYTVKIVPEPRVKRHTKQIFKQLLLKCPEIQSCLAATDEAQWILTCKKILCDEVSVFCDPDDHGKFSVEYTCGLDLVDDEPIPLQQLLNGLANPDIHEKVSDEDYVIQMLNILMTSHAYGDKGIAIVGKGRLKFFYIDNRQESMNLTGGLEVLRGCISSVRPAGTQLLLNLNVSNSAFYQSMNLAHFIEEVLRQNWDDLEILNRYLRGVKVELRYGHQIYNDFKEKVYRTNSILGLASKEDEERHASRETRPPKVRKFGAGPDEVEFWFKENEQSRGQYITVTQFFKNRYNVTLRDKSKPVVNTGNQSNAIYIPSEVLWIVKGQTCNGELSTSQRQNIIKFSCRQPPDNFQTIQTLGREIMGITANHFTPRQIKFSNEMVVVPGRVLDPPTLKYGSRTEKPQRGSWNLVGKQFSMGISIDTWAVLWIKTAGTRTPPDQVQGAVDTFKKKLGEMGMRVGQRVGLDAIDVRGSIDEQNHIIEGTLQRLAQKKVSLLLIILPVGGDRIFRYVKWRADCEYGIPNHCVLVDKFAKGNPQYMANNGLKVNLKLHGINHILDTSASGILAAGKTMVVGIDATHPSPTDCENFPTIAAVVASTDGRLGQWPGDISLQTSKREILDKMTELMDGRLRHWAKINKSLPANIIVYRDGVSEGQYAEVVRDELASIRRSIKNQYKSAPPKITFIVVTKRHHVRFFPTNAEGCDDKSNCKNGTIVDRGITRPWQWDFYLQAQAPLQGSARPAHYVVLHDEIFSPSSRTAADDIQQLTHNICYMMARCTRSISYATPAFLADRLCDRARRYVLACYEDKQQKNPDVKRSNLRPTQKEVSIHTRLADTMVYI